MDHSSRPAEGEQLLDRMRQVPPRAPGEALRPTDETRILELSAEGLTQQEIAAAMSCSQSTVSRTLADYQDTRSLARKYLESRALDLSRRFVDDAKPADALRMLGKLDVVRDEDARVGVGVQIIIGTPEHPALDASSITVTSGCDASALSRNDDADR